MTRVLVTGGAGYIGSHTCKALAQVGFEPIVFDNLSRGHKDFVRWGPLEIGNLGDLPRLSEVIARYSPVAVLHFAAYAYVGESVQEPAIYYQNNVVGTLSLLEALRIAKIDKLVFSSTCATYGIPSIVPIPVDHPQNPINPYGRTKLIIEGALNDYGMAYGLRSFALRYFNAAGADESGEIGERHDPETHAIPLAIMTALGRRERFGIFGTDYDTEDGTAVRDYIHVSDLADAHVRAVSRLLEGDPGGPLNLGTGRGSSVRELVQSVERVSGRSLIIDELPRREGDPPVLVADGTEASRRLGWKPRYNHLDDIMSSALVWHEKNL